MLNRLFQWKNRKTAKSEPDKESDHPAAIQRWLQERIGEELGVDGESVDPTKPFTKHGLDSIAGFMLACDLADWLGRDLPASLLWDYPTIAELAQHLGKTRTVS